MKQTPEVSGYSEGEILNRLPRNLQIKLLYLFNEADEWLPKLTWKDLWRPLVGAVLALQMAACKPTVGYENPNTSSPPAITEIYKASSIPPEPTTTSTLTPWPTPTSNFEPPAISTVTLPPTFTPTSVPKKTPTPTLSPTFTPTPEPTATSTTKPTETFQSQSQEIVLKVPPDIQDYSLSCESSASEMIAKYFLGNPPKGYVSWEEYFIKNLPLDDNPHYGFCGKINGVLSTSCQAPYGYGVYAEPLAAIFNNNLGLKAEVWYGVDYNAIKEAIAEGKVAIVWVSGKDPKIYPAEVRIDPKRNEEYRMVLGEHAWVIAGYRINPDGSISFLVIDPLKKSPFWVKRFPRWDDFGRMTLVVGPNEVFIPRQIFSPPQ